MMGYRCPNGHPTPAEKLVRCSQCRAFVTYEPAAVGLALRRQLISAVVDDTDESVRPLDDARGLADVYVEALRDG
jgi:hypothetical protein